MRTLFSCPELALQIEGFDTHTYQVEDRVHVRHRDRLVSLVVESVQMHAGLREVGLRPVSPEEPIPASPNRVPKPPSRQAKAIDPAWVDRFCDSIEGAEGPVLWEKPPRSR